MENPVIAVVGGGATALSFLNGFLKERQHEKRVPITIYVVEKRRFRGRGLAYDLDLPTNLLNTRAGFITPFAEKPGHFFEWLIANRTAWEDEFPGLDVNAQTFVPRSLFGLYLEYAMSDLAGDLAHIGIQLIHVRAEVTEIQRLTDGHLSVCTDSSLRIRADQAVLCCGNLQSREFKAFEKHEGFHASPYPIRRLARSAEKKRSVAILGARLSAIDVAVGLAGAGFDGQMTMISRSGYFPSVRGTQSRYIPSILTLDRLREHNSRHGNVRLTQVHDWIMQELVLAGSPILAVCDLPLSPPANVEAFLETEIAAAAVPRPWQAVLYSTNTVIDYLWQILDDADRGKFLKDYAAAWMSYRVSIPVENAVRLLDLARSGLLRFARGAATVTAVEEGKFQIALATSSGEARQMTADMVVGAFGTPRDPRCLDSHLVQSLMDVGLARAHRHGGLDVDASSGALIDCNGSLASDIFAIGELTAGVYFFTSVLEINARHAARVAHCMSNALAHRQFQTEIASTAVPHRRANGQAAEIAV